METARTTDPVPSLKIREIKPLHHTIESVNPDSPKSKTLPAGMQFIEIARFIGTTAPADPSQYTHLLFSGKFRNFSKFASANASLRHGILHVISAKPAPKATGAQQ